MSADNTVILLITKGRDDWRGAEYRVAHVQAAENMTWEADYPSKDNPLFNREWVLDAFGRSRVFTDAADALGEAIRVEKQADYVEYGIVFVIHPKVYFPASDRKRRQRRFFRPRRQEAWQAR